MIAVETARVEHFPTSVVGALIVTLAHMRIRVAPTLLPLVIAAFIIPLMMCGGTGDNTQTDASASGSGGGGGSGGSTSSSSGGGSSGTGSSGAGSSGGGSSAGSSGAGSSGAGSSGAGSSGTGSSGVGSSGGGSSGAGSSSGGSSSGAAGSSVLQHRNHPNRDGFFIDSKLTKAAAATMHNDPAFTAAINGKAFATPLFVQGGVVPGLNGGKGAVFVATETNDIYALDEMTGAAAWHVTAGTPATGPAVNCGNIKPQGVTGTPAIDLATSLIVFDAAQGPGALSDHVIYGLDLATGTTKWKTSLKGTKSANGAFDPSQHLQRPAALIVNGYAYFAYGGNIGDCGNYYGWVIGVALDGDVMKTRSFRTDDTQCGIWGPGGPAYDGNSIFVTTGNGSSPSSWAGSEAIIRLGLDLSFTKNPMDYYAPTNYASLDSSDTDINGSGPLVIDTQGLKAVLALGKSGTAYLVDRTNLGGVGAKIAGQTKLSGGPISNAAAWATIGGTTYVVANNNSVPSPGGCTKGGGNLFAVKLDMAAPQMMTELWCGDGGGATSPIITSSDGTNDAIVWVAGDTNGKLNAFDLVTGAPIPNSAAIPGMQHLSPSVTAANGRIYAASNNGKVYAVTP